MARGDMTTDETEMGEYGRGTRGYGTGGDTHRIVDEAKMNVDGGSTRAPGALQRHIKGTPGAIP